MVVDAQVSGNETMLVFGVGEVLLDVVEEVDLHLVLGLLALVYIFGSEGKL